MSERSLTDLKFDVIQGIYDGEIMYCDKKPVNKRIESLFNEISVLWEENDTKVIEELIDKYTEILSLSEVEAFAKGIKFIIDLKEDVKKVCL